jgi:membrane protein
MKMLKKLLSTPTAQLGKASRFVVFQIKMWSHCARLLSQNRSGQQAAALSYHTIFGIVPLAIVALMIFQSFSAYADIGERVKTLLYDHLNLSQVKFTPPDTKETTLTDYLDGIITGFFANLNKGSLTIVSAILVIWAALDLLSTIERSFNNIWHVTKGRSFLHRMINYWALLTLGPLLLGVAIYITTRYATVGTIHKTLLSYIGPAVLSYIIATVAFFLLYFVLPNTKVNAKAAIWGAAVAALVWTLAKWGFGQYVTEFIPYSNIYGVIGLVPLGVLWIFITWLIVLFGLQLTFTTQHLKTLDAAQIASAKKTEEYFLANDTTAINIVREIAEAFEQNQAPVPPELVLGKLNIPAELGDKVLNLLTAKGLVARTSDPRVGYLPAKDPANIKLSDIADAVAAASFAQDSPEQSPAFDQIIQTQHAALARHSVRQLLVPPKIDKKSLLSPPAE